ncbi:MAG: hypothetical protein GY696_27965, partial [Gammaproteobacteria bacterium]|nr:hypothetical protein [Gammaproteobacteria bacterium]
RVPPLFDLEEPFQLTTDFSSKAISAILSQVQDGQERLIVAVGRKTTTAERNYASYKGEMAAVIFGCRKFNPILSYRRFVLNTDSSALLQIKNLKPQTSMLIRWTEELAALDFEVKHRPGQLNTNANAISCREDEFMPPPTDQEEKEQTWSNLTRSSRWWLAWTGMGPRWDLAPSQPGYGTMVTKPTGRSCPGGGARMVATRRNTEQGDIERASPSLPPLCSGSARAVHWT